MKAEYVLKMIASGRLTELEQACKEEITYNALSKDKKDLYKARLNLSKQACKQNAQKRLAGAYVYAGKQMICNGYFGVIYDDIYDGLVNVPDDISDPLDVKTLIPDLSNYHRSKVNLDEPKAKCKIFRVSARKKPLLFVQLNNIIVNVDYLLDVCNSLEKPRVYVGNKYNDLICVKAENGTAVVCPCKITAIDDPSLIIAAYNSWEVDDDAKIY